MVDRTADYRTALTAAASAEAGNSVPSDALKAQLFPPVQRSAALPFTVAALSQLKSVRTMHDFVLNNKAAYLNSTGHLTTYHQPAMTDPERDVMENTISEFAASFVQQIDKLKAEIDRVHTPPPAADDADDDEWDDDGPVKRARVAAVAIEPPNNDLRAHQHTVILFLYQRVQHLTQVMDGLRKLRFARAKQQSAHTRSGSASLSLSSPVAGGGGALPAIQGTVVPLNSTQSQPLTLPLSSPAASTLMRDRRDRGIEPDAAQNPHAHAHARRKPATGGGGSGDDKDDASDLRAELLPDADADPAMAGARAAASAAAAAAVDDPVGAPIGGTANPFQWNANETQVMEAENADLLDELEAELDLAQNTQSKILEIAKLMDTFSSKLMEQEEQINHIYDSAVDAFTHVQRGNVSLREATKTGVSFRIYMLAAILTLSFSLLFLDWYWD